MYFRDRQDAGQQLAARIKEYKFKDPIVLGLARGGVPVAYEIAKALQAPLDVLVVRKLGVPWNPELAMGAVAPGAQVLNEELIKQLGISHFELDTLIRLKEEEVNQRIHLYRGDRPYLELKNKTVILVDDGLATGSTMKVAVHAVRSLQADKIMVAVPVGPPDTVYELKSLADEVICLYEPYGFMAVGGYYLSFSQTSDEEVIRLLDNMN